MNKREYVDRLGASIDDPGELFEHFQRRSLAAGPAHVLPSDRHGIERGTVILPGDDVIVRGYPSIPRVLVIDPGIRRFFGDDSSIAIEEKLDGANVRIVQAGEAFAFTRSGLICPFTTARARELLDLDGFFAAHPEAMLCAELIGPESPYTRTAYESVESTDLQVFDIRDRESGEPLPVAERRAHCERFGFSQPPCFDVVSPDDAVARVREVITDLDEAGREGIILRSADARNLLKYTTKSQHHDELAFAFGMPFDHGQEFLFSRILREGFQA